ncbi:MAG: sigma-70 family RNA polymerase sigma factor [Flavobacteriales bacterium]|nr:sigma-70 family RNA polymerase sigma factor [Flavobacteriales bacterium]
MKDAKIIELIRSGRPEKGLSQLYRSLPKIERLITSKGGSKQDAQDVLQEALIVLCRKVRTEEFELTAALDTYLYSVCRFLWKNQSKKLGIETVSGGEAAFDVEHEKDLEAALERESKFQRLEEVLGDLGERCLQLLQLFYFHGQSMKSIASKMSFSSENVAKTQKYKCIERAKKMVRAAQVEPQNLMP